MSSAGRFLRRTEEAAGELNLMYILENKTHHAHSDKEETRVPSNDNNFFFHHSWFFPRNKQSELGVEKKKTTQSNLLESKQAFKTSLVSAALISELVSGKSAHSSHQDLKPLSGSLGRLAGREESVRCFSGA